MNDYRGHDPARRGRGPGQAVLLAGLAAALALLTAACGGSSPGGTASAAAPPTYEQLLAYAQCMRTHGAPTFPDPVQGPGGYWTFLSTSPASGVNGPGVPTAQQACKKLQPKQGQLPASVLRAAMARGLKFAACMRAHGIADFPDPVERGGSIGIQLGPADRNNPRFKTAQQACQAYGPGAKTGGTK